MITGLVFKLIERRREPTEARESALTVRHCGVCVTCIAVIVTSASLFCDAEFWHAVVDEPKSGHEFFLVGTFAIAMLAIAVNLYLSASQRRRNLVAMAGGLVSFVAFMAVLIVWYRRLIS
jgi:hypothetical protein